MTQKLLKSFMILSLLIFLIPAVTQAADKEKNSVEAAKKEWNDALHESEKKQEKSEKKSNNKVKPKDVKQGGVSLVGKQYPTNHYFPVVTDDSSWWPFSSEEISKGINSVSTGIFALNKQLSEVVDAALDRFLSLNVIEKVQNTVTNASDKLWSSMKTHFAAILLVIAVTQIFVYYVAERNGNKAGRTSLKLLAILGVAFLWISNSGYYLNVLNHWSSQAQGYVMSAGTALTTDVDEIEKGKEVEGSAALLRNSFFQMTVRRPYLVMNYGTTDEKKIEEKADKGEKRIEDMLALKTNEKGSDARDELAKKEVDKKNNNYMDQSSVWSKFGISLLSVAFTLFLGIPLFILVFFNVLIQFMVLMIAFILPITFIVSILPSFANSGWHALGRLISTFMMKMFISILILFTFMIFNVVDELLPPTSVGVYYLNMTLSAFLMLFMIMKRDKIVEFITAGRVVGMSGQFTGGMYNGARRASNMTRTAGSHATTKALTAGTMGMTVASAVQSGAYKGLDRIRSRKQNRTPQTTGVLAGQSDKQQQTRTNGNIVDLNRYRDGKNRTPQGNGTGQQNGKGSVDLKNKTNIAHDIYNNGDGPKTNRNDVRNRPNDESDGKSNEKKDEGIKERNAEAERKIAERRNIRTLPAGKDLEDNPQTSGAVTPPKRLTQWEADKQVENQNQKGVKHPGRHNKTSRKNRSPQEINQPQEKQLIKENRKKQRKHQVQQMKATNRQKREEHRNIRMKKVENRETFLDKSKDKMKEGRRKLVERRRRRRGKR